MHSILTSSAAPLLLLQKPVAGEERHITLHGGERIYATFPASDVQVAHSGSDIVLEVSGEKIVLEGAAASIDSGTPLAMMLQGAYVVIASEAIQQLSPEEYISATSRVFEVDGLNSACLSDAALHSAPPDPFGEFAEQVVNVAHSSGLMQRSSGGIEESHSSYPMLGYRDNIEFGEIIHEWEPAPDFDSFNYNNHASEYREVVEAPSSPHKSDPLSELLSGERLDSLDEEMIHFYDGEPINIGTPVVIDPVAPLPLPVPHERGEGETRIVFDPQGGDSPLVQGGGSFGPLAFAENKIGGGDTLPVVKIDFASMDEATLKLDEYLDGTQLRVASFELGRDAITLDSVLEVERVETLRDNNPVESRSAEGDFELGFALRAEDDAAISIVFEGMTMNEYMEFIASGTREAGIT